MIDSIYIGLDLAQAASLPAVGLAGAYALIQWGRVQAANARRELDYL